MFEHIGNDLQVLAVDEENHFLASATRLTTGTGPVQFFHFDTAVSNINRIKFIAKSIRTGHPPQSPLWIWMGVK